MADHFNGTHALLIKVLPPVLITEIILGVVGNGLALWIFCFHLKPWKSSTVLLFNLALADFLLIAALPFRASYYVSEMTWYFGDIFCNINLFMLAMNRTGSIMFLLAVAVDRYVRVVHPHHPINSLSIHKAVCCAVGLWLVTISMTAHLLAIPRNNTILCESFTPPVKLEGQSNSGFSLTWHRSVFVLSFWLPLAAILYCTFQIIRQLSRGQLAQHAKIKKALWLITVVVIVFTVCFLPSNIAQLHTWMKSQSTSENLDQVFYITITLTYLNCILDPVVYYFSSPTFQKISKRAIGLHQASETGDTAEARRSNRDTGSKTISQV